MTVVVISKSTALTRLGRTVSVKYSVGPENTARSGPDFHVIHFAEARSALGQRSEPELGLGMVLRADSGGWTAFSAANEQRQYALKTAPLRRVQFKDGDQIKLHDGKQLSVDSAEDRAGLMVYRCGDREVPEAQLCDTISFSNTDGAAAARQVDELETFERACEASTSTEHDPESPGEGYVGGGSLFSHTDVDCG